MTIPPVIDSARHTAIHEAASRSSFSIMNIVAIVAIIVIGYFLYRKFLARRPTRRFPLVPTQPPQPKVQTAPIVEEMAQDEIPEEEEVPDAKEA